MTHWLGLTGGIGSGKSAATDFFMSLGVEVIDADKISRTLTATNGQALPAIAAQFGSDAVRNHELNRDFMRELVFKRPVAKEQLEAILHPMIYATIKSAQQQISANYAIVDVPLLTELPDFQRLVERIVVIDCPEELQIQRVMARSGLSREQITAIMLQQATRAQRLAIADDVIVNDGGLMQLQQAVSQHHQFYQHLFSAQ